MSSELNSELAIGSSGRPRVLLLGRTDRPMVFVCSPFAGSVQENIQNARRYSRFAYLSGYMPITPHLMYPRFLDDKQFKERQDGMEMGLRHLDFCEEIWVFGEHYSSGMQADRLCGVEELQTRVSRQQGRRTGDDRKGESRHCSRAAVGDITAG